jgi:hypothetical protein
MRHSAWEAAVAVAKGVEVVAIERDRNAVRVAAGRIEGGLEVVALGFKVERTRSTRIGLGSIFASEVVVHIIMEPSFIEYIFTFS